MPKSVSSKQLNAIRKGIRSGLRRSSSKRSSRKSCRSRRSASRTLDIEIRPKSRRRQFKEAVTRQKSAQVVNLLKQLTT